MIIEIGMTIGIYTLYKYTSSIIRDYINGKHKIKAKFDSIMLSTGIKNKNNDTFSVYEIYFKDYGYLSIISVPYGLSLEHLEAKKNILEDNLNSIIVLEKDKFKNYITMKVITKDISKFDYKPIKQKVNELYLGKDCTSKNYLLNLNNNPMLLIAGSTGQGKTVLLSVILTNLIYNNSKQSEIYFIQLIKSELASFNDCSNVKFNASNGEELNHLLTKVNKKLNERSKLFEANGIKNITQWNKHFKNKYMKRIFVVCEEFSELIDLPYIDKLWSIIKAGRSVGIHFIGVLQRTTSDNLNTSIKSQMTKLTFHQNSSINSQNVINSNSAIKLKQGECIILDEEGEKKLKVPYVDDDLQILHEYVPSIRVPSETFKKPIQEPKIITKEETNNNLNNTKTIKPIETIKPKKSKARKGVINIKEIKEYANKQR